MAVVRLVGVQDCEVTVQHPGTDEAVVAVRIGKALLYLHQEQTAEHFLAVWDESKEAALSLPDRSDRELVRPIRGMPEPAVAVNAIGRPAGSILAGATKGVARQPFVRVQVGRIAFEVRDRRAHFSCLMAFREARRAAAAAFLEPGTEHVVRGAAAAAADAFFPHPQREDQRVTPMGLRLAAKTADARPEAVSATRAPVWRQAQAGPIR